MKSGSFSKEKFMGLLHVNLIESFRLVLLHYLYQNLSHSKNSFSDIIENKNSNSPLSEKNSRHNLKKYLLSLLFTALGVVSVAQFPASVDSVYTFMRYNSVHRNSVDWDSVDRMFSERLKNAQTLADTMQCFVMVLESLKDVHSQIYLYNQYFGHYPAFDDSILLRLRPLSEKSRIETNQIHTARPAAGVSYLRVPTFMVSDAQQVNAYAQALRDSVDALCRGRAKGLIIDLRLNGGGNLYPMLSGLGCLLGNRVIGYETNADESIVRTWEINNGNFTLDGYQTTALSNRCDPELESLPVVVITGPATRSSGSMTAIAFKGRENTLFIGEPTASGYTTSNGYFQFAPGLMMNFSVGFVADRNKHLYKTAVDPDHLLPFSDNFENLKADEKVQHAIHCLLHP